MAEPTACAARWALSWHVEQRWRVHRSVQSFPVISPVLSAWAGVDPTLTGRKLQDALHLAIATRRGYFYWTVDHTRWVVLLNSPEEQTFLGRSMQKPVWLPAWLRSPYCRCIHWSFTSR